MSEEKKELKIPSTEATELTAGSKVNPPNTLVQSLAQNLVDLAIQWKKCEHNATYALEGFPDVILMNEMANLILKTYTDIDSKLESKES